MGLFELLYPVSLLLVLYLISEYFHRRTSDRTDEHDSRPTTARHPDGVRGSSAASSGDGSPATVPCPACGTENDRAYTFCQYCAAKLPQ